MQFDDKKIKQILFEGSYISEDTVKKADEFYKLHRTGFVEYLLGEGLITKNIIWQAMAESFKVPYSDLNSNAPSHEQVTKIPEEIAKQFHVVFFSEEKGKIVVTTDKPEQPWLVNALQKLFPKQKILITFSLWEDVNASFVHYSKNIETRFSDIIQRQGKIAPELLNAIFSDALTLNVSDIHFEPAPMEVLIRFRIDGVLRDAGKIPMEHYENIINRIKVQSGIRLDQHFSTQDGAMQFDNGELRMDIRTSIVPTVEWEKVVLRILSSYIQWLSLGELGLLEEQQKVLEDIANKPFGMIVVSGPTGSGKTTTLYALLKLLNQSDVNITTIEDPVEYKMRGINQIQVNTLTGLTFSKWLRSIVRQDPDTIFVGEIRDEETAEIAVNAALTGHLLLSSFHANDAATAIPRLLDMGIEAFLLASTLNLVIAQRLIRKICPHCRHSEAITMESMKKNHPNLAHYFKGKSTTLYSGKWCDVCGNSWYKGQSAIFEFIIITPELQNLILKNPSSQEIWKMARLSGSKTLFEDGIEKVKNGVTTLEELLRVAEAPSDK